MPTLSHPTHYPTNNTTQLANLEGLLLDCDGVLTDGSIYYDVNGNRTLNFFARDGLGLALLCKVLKVAVISGRPTDIAELRHKELGVEFFLGRCKNKEEGVQQACQALGIAPDRCAFVGDDLADLPGFNACGLKIAVADAVSELQEQADWITNANGGRGAVREICEAILKARGDWKKMALSAQSK